MIRRSPILLALAATLVWAPARATVPFAAPDDLRPGQRAVVRTVFEGSKVEEFEAEILGVLHNGRVAGDLVIARATSERVARTGIAQGMSGSPVYVDGKLVGALSSGWSFTKEPIFGITPIREMLEVLDRPSVAVEGATAGPSGVEAGAMSAGVRFGEFEWAEDSAAGPADDDDRGGATDPSAPVDAAGLAPLRVPLACIGLGSGAFEYASRLLAPLRLAPVPGGRAAHGGPDAASLEPGSAIAVDLLRGDLQLSAIGTVTYVDRKRVLAFGHPFFQAGDVRLPLATAEIATIVPSDEVSFKLGMRGRTIGVLDQDRRAAVAGTIGAGPRMLPLTVALSGFAPQPQTYRFESIEDRNLAPVLAAIATLNSVLESGGASANQTLRWSLRLARSGAPPLEISDVVVGDSPPADLANAVLSPLRFLFANPYGRLALDSIAVRVASEPGRDLWTLRNVRLLDNAVRPGGTVRVRCELARWRGPIVAREIELHVPEELPRGSYVAWVGGAAELARFEAQRLPGRYRPVSLDDAWSRLSRARPADALYAAILARAPEVSADGRDYPELPISALPLLASELTSGERGRGGDLALLGERRLPVGGLVRGQLTIGVDVDPHAP